MDLQSCCWAHMLYARIEERLVKIDTDGEEVGWLSRDWVLTDDLVTGDHQTVGHCRT